MTDPREPGVPEEPNISLPSWVDAAIAKSSHPGTPKPDSSSVTDPGPAAEMVANAPPPEAQPSAAPESATTNPPEGGAPVVVADSPRQARRRAGLPWIALALLFVGAALVIAYILLTRPVQR